MNKVKINQIFKKVRQTQGYVWKAFVSKIQLAKDGARITNKIVPRTICCSVQGNQMKTIEELGSTFFWFNLK